MYPHLDEQARRLWTATEAMVIGRGGTARVHDATGISKPLMRYSLQGNRKTREGSAYQDRNGQFLFINDRAATALAHGQPVISVHTGKKELVGDGDAGESLPARDQQVEHDRTPAAMAA